ncbi:MAG TPA: VWA domain-containing protein, partial [Sorangium sp.]|nr:VWA domain-containing protein [Sorangium sp.]
AAAVKRVLLLSDGQATVGVRDSAAFGRLAERARDMGCAITAIGVDVDYNERIMSTIARRSNGRHYFVENPAELARVFDRERQSLVRTVAANGEMRIALGAGVQLLEVFDRSFRREGNTLVVPMGTFAAAENKTVLLKVRLPRGATGIRSVAQIDLAFEDLVQGKPDHCGGQVATELTRDVAKVASLDPLVASRLHRSLTAAVLTDANALFKRGKVASANRLLREKRRSLQRQRTSLVATTPRPRRKEVEHDLDAQLGALEPFAEAAGPRAPASQTRQGKASVHANAAVSDKFAL